MLSLTDLEEKDAHCPEILPRLGSFRTTRRGGGSTTCHPKIEEVEFAKGVPVWVVEVTFLFLSCILHLHFDLEKSKVCIRGECLFVSDLSSFWMFCFALWATRKEGLSCLHSCTLKRDVL